ncbi:MAG: hypothetical protein HY261_00110, partial [Chloroflexi bacterium]|nr:hypothetical protein [Chloroflexota bacterium]
SLTYNFQILAAGDYTLWIRDFDDNKHPLGARVVNINIDNKDAGNYDSIDIASPGPKGDYGWHATAKVRLEAGKHTMKVTKVATTSSAAILDTFYFTSNPADQPDQWAKK